jgi:hypothetical protein
MPKVEISCGDLIDRITILTIKRRRLQSNTARRNVERELDALERAQAELGPIDSLEQWKAELERLNTVLWDLEDGVRRRAAQADFGEEFIQAACAIFRTNDQRAALKRQINLATESNLIEEKLYAPSPAHQAQPRAS